MPNHCSNITTFYGSKKQIEEIRKTFEEAEDHSYSGKSFIRELIPIPDVVPDPYAWTYENWGCKSADYWTEEIENKVDDGISINSKLPEHEDFITFSYSTAWSPAVVAVKKITKEKDLVAINAFIETGGDFCGYAVVVDGDVVEDVTDNAFRKTSSNFINWGTMEVSDRIPEDWDEDEVSQITDLAVNFYNIELGDNSYNIY